MEKKRKEDDDRVMAIVAAALQAPSHDREHLVQQACRQDAQLLGEVAEILEWEERMGRFLDTPLIKLADLEEFDRPFGAGDIISNRFEIIHEIGYGGMGVVYEAFDRTRNCRIAIKSSKPGFRQLLSPELEGALKVRHRNICLVNEIHTAATTFGEVEFLTMEFLEGETLAAFLQKQSRPSSRETLEIARQLCAGLAEAHRSEIIHRDLKTSNVILARTEGQPLRAVITDFGLAGSAGLDREQFGTPRYMAPELLQGGKTSKASDIYALGIILRELVGAENVPQGNRNPNYDRRWDKVIRQCLDPVPDARPNANQVVSVFDRRPVWKTTLLLVFLFALVALGMALYNPVRQLLKAPDIRLAFLPVEAPPDLAGLGNGVLHDVADRINRSQRAGTTVVAMPISETAPNSIQTPQEAQALLHATHAVQVKLSHQGETVAARLLVFDLAAQRRVREFSGTYSQTTVGSMPGAFAGAVRLALRLHSVDADSLSGPATAAYDRGLFFLRKDDDSFGEAIPMFQTAARLDPHSPLPLAGFAEAKIRQFAATKDHNALDEAAVALGSAESLNPDSVAVHLVAGLLKKTQGQYEKALEDYRRVQELAPRNIDALLRTASVYAALDDPDNAMECYQKAIALEPGYYATYQRLGRFYYYRGDYQRAAEQFQKTVERAPGLYGAYSELGSALDYLGRDREAKQALLASLQLKETAGALNSLGGIEVYQNRDAEAAKYFQRASQIDTSDYIYLLNMGDASRRLGRRVDARSAYRKAMVLALGELKVDPRSGLVRSYVAYLAARLGQTQRAEEQIAEARRFSPSDNIVLRKAVLTYEALGERDHAIDALLGASEDAFRELGRHPDLAALRQDLRFKQIAAKLSQSKKASNP